MAAVENVLAWWVAQMRDLLPRRMVQAELHGPALIADVRPNAPGVTFVQRGRRRELPVLDTNLPRLRRVLLRVPGAAVLDRRLVLPLATEPALDRVLEYELDRVSPFAAAEVAWAHVVESRDRAAGRLHVRLALLPRATIAPALATLRGMGREPAAVIAPREGGGMWHIALRPTAAMQPGWRRPATAAAALACALLAIAAVALPFLRQQSALDRTEQRIEAARPLVAQADALRRRIADGTGGQDAVAAEAARVGQPLNALAALTALLPDDTYLTALSLKQRALTITGRSASAARLIPLLAADPGFRNAAFAAPVTRAEGTRGDLFSIRAEFGS